jgi:hypothetical protein
VSCSAPSSRTCATTPRRSPSRSTVPTFTDSQGRQSTTGLLRFKEECVFNPMDLLVTRTSEKPGRPPVKRARASEWLTQYLYAAIEDTARVEDIGQDAGRMGITLHTLERAATLDVKVKKFQKRGAPRLADGAPQ